MQIILIASISEIIIYPTSVQPPHLRTPSHRFRHTLTHTHEHTRCGKLLERESALAVWRGREEEGGSPQTRGAAGLFGLQPRWMLYRRRTESLILLGLRVSTPPHPPTQGFWYGEPVVLCFVWPNFGVCVRPCARSRTHNACSWVQVIALGTCPDSRVEFSPITCHSIIQPCVIILNTHIDKYRVKPFQ